MAPSMGPVPKRRASARSSRAVASPLMTPEPQIDNIVGIIQESIIAVTRAETECTAVA